MRKSKSNKEAIKAARYSEIAGQTGSACMVMCRKCYKKLFAHTLSSNQISEEGFTNLLKERGWLFSRGYICPPCAALLMEEEE